MGKKGGAKQPVVDYRLSLHLGACLGPVDKVLAMKIGEKDIDIDEQLDSGFIDISNVELFGGPRKGGGIKGRIYFLFGKPDQIMPTELALKFQRTPTNMTGFRGLLSLFFTATGSNNGFTWGANNPIVPPTEVTVQRAPAGGLTGNPMIGTDANPSHIIYECLVNTNWGVGYSVNQIDVDSFIECAEALLLENFGLSFIWITSTPVESFVNEVLQHISANLSFNTATGKWHLKLLRKDYDAAQLKKIDPSNAILNNFQRKGWGETINEIIVTWTNPENENEETVSQHDNANIAIQGTTVSDSKNYPGIRNRQLALRTCERDLRQSTAPLAAADVDLDRSLWDIKPGDVVIFDWPELSEVPRQIIMRVLRTDYGFKGSSRLKVNLLEDIFSFGVSVIEAQDSEFESPAQIPIDVPNYMIESAPYYAVAAAAGDATAQAIGYPEIRAACFVSSGLIDIRQIDVLSDLPIAGGGTTYAEVAVVDELGRFILEEALIIEQTTTLTPPTTYTGRSLAIGGFIFLVNPTDQTIQEIMLVSAFVGADVTVYRGMLDTVPKAWPIGTVAWVLSRSNRIIDGTERAAAETAVYKFLPITSLGRLDPSIATEHTQVIGDRMHRPLRPSNIQIDTQGIPSASVSAAVVDFTITWSDRNRLTETAVLRQWGDAGVTKEVGQTTTLRVTKLGVETYIETGLTTQTKTLTPAAVSGTAGDTLVVELFSVLDGLESLYRTTINLVLT